MFCLITMIFISKKYVLVHLTRYE